MQLTANLAKPAGSTVKARVSIGAAVFCFMICGFTLNVAVAEEPVAVEESAAVEFLQQVATAEFTQRLLVKLVERCPQAKPLAEVEMDELRMVVKDKTGLSYLEILRVYIDNHSVREKIAESLQALETSQVACDSLDFKMYHHARVLEFKQAKQWMIAAEKLALAGDR